MSPNEIPGGFDDLEPLHDGADLEPLLDGGDLEPLEPEIPVHVPVAESTFDTPEQAELPDILQPEPMEDPEPVLEPSSPEPEALIEEEPASVEEAPVVSEEPSPEPEAEAVLMEEPEVTEEPTPAEGAEDDDTALGVAAVGAASLAGDAAVAAATEEDATSSGGRRGDPKRPAKRELEKTTLMLLKASQYLMYASFLPFAGPSDNWVLALVEKLVCALGIWLACQGQLAHAGEKAAGFMKGLVKGGTRNGTIVALVVALLGFLPFATGFEFEWTSFREKITLLCAGFTFAHILGYQHGGKFNPGIATLLILPFFAGIGGLIGWIGDWGAGSPLVGVIGVLGALAVLLCGMQAIWTFVLALKEAKREGEAKKKATLEARRAARKAGKKVPPRSSKR